TSLLDSGVLIRRFQNEYPAQAQAVGLDDALLTRIDESRATQLLETSRWYMDRGDPVSARVMLRRLLRNHPQTASAARAYEMLKKRGWLEEEAPEEAAGDKAPAEPSDAARAGGTAPAGTEVSK
ncbi:MAG TPA: hypothetical protein VEB22_01105, partial [Phycisphaerales bacterium]|nr:hypothetical protein [Phycisphaerales bacterium]